MTDYIFTGETLDGKTVEGYVFTPNAPKCDANFGIWIISENYMDFNTWFGGSKASLTVHAFQVKPESVRLKSVPLRVAVESIVEYCISNNYCTIKCKMYETCVNYIQNPDFPRFWQWLDGLAG